MLHAFVSGVDPRALSKSLATEQAARAAAERARDAVQVKLMRAEKELVETKKTITREYLADQQKTSARTRREHEVLVAEHQEAQARARRER